VLNIGGGFGVDYTTSRAATPEQFAATIVPRLLPLVERAQPVQIILEPGRSIAATAGLLLTTVQYVKPGRERTFAICDAGMHTLIRPALYQAFHFIWPAVVPPALIPKTLAQHPDLPGLHRYDVVGPLCESGDFLAQDRDLPPVKQGDTLAVFTTGAYGMTMTSSYNDHPRPAEVLVEGSQARLIRRRESVSDLSMHEHGLQPP
jgi:diaminopimelate decarboxylase